MPYVSGPLKVNIKWQGKKEAWSFMLDAGNAKSPT